LVKSESAVISTWRNIAEPAVASGGMTQVTPRLVQVVLDTTDARSAAEFWRQLLGLFYRSGDEPPDPGEDDPAGRDWLNLRLPEGTPLLAFQQVSELGRATWPGQRIPQQLHLDLMVRDVAELDAVHARVIELGGGLRFDRSDDEEEPLRVFTDPDGHPFCVFVTDD
jgi:catechol 2,3-dioxygenase-like lactoylglutathione lyase family enzyme